MSHIFISYSDNTKLRDKLIAYLDRNNLEYWFDRGHIPKGEDWANEIDSAVDEASLMIVIVTAESLESKYVLYEWARARGAGISVIPLVFRKADEDAIAHQHTSENRHPLCLRMQYVKFNDKDFINHVRYNLYHNPAGQLLNKEIADCVLEFRVLARVALWLCLYAINGLIDNSSLVNDLLKKTDDKLFEIYYRNLPATILKIPASRYTQIKINELLNEIYNFHEDLNRLTSGYNFDIGQASDQTVQEVEQARIDRLEPRFQYFDNYPIPLRIGFYERFDKGLEAIDNRKSPSAVSDDMFNWLSALTRYSDDPLIRDATKAIDTIKQNNVP